MENGLNDLKISGVVSANGGKYNVVRISGAGHILGDIECEEFYASGASNVKGNIKARTVRTSGVSDIHGNVAAEEIKISGASDIHGNVETKKVKISGSSDIKGNLYAEEIEVSGNSDINGDCEAKSFKARGGFDIGGLLNAVIIEIDINGKCKVREIGGEKINVRNGINSADMFTKIIKYLSSQEEKLTTSVIEGDDIYLEITSAKIVRGNNVEIGPGCLIEVVEYKENIKISEDSKVEKIIKVE